MNVVLATIATGVVGLVLQFLIERIFLSHHGERAEVELLFSQLPLIAAALFAAGLLIIYSGVREERNRGRKDITTAGATWIGIVQGLCLPFRGFSRSGATISTSLILGIDKRRAEEFSFALAVVLTPMIIAKELFRLVKAQPETSNFAALLQPGLIGMVLASFLVSALSGCSRAGSKRDVGNSLVTIAWSSQSSSSLWRSSGTEAATPN